MKKFALLLTGLALLCQSCQVNYTPPVYTGGCGGGFAPPPVQPFSSAYGYGQGGGYWGGGGCGGQVLVGRRITTTTTTTWGGYPCGSPSCVPSRRILMEPRRY